MNNCSICGEEEYSIDSKGTVRRYKTENVFMCATCTQKYINLPNDKREEFKIPFYEACREKGKTNERKPNKKHQ